VGGVGGTGVVTVGQLITMAAHLEGRGSSVLDFTGFAQKGGTVLSYVRMAPSPHKLHQMRISNGQADAVIACDLVVASSQKALSVLRSNHTRVVANEAELPTADYVLFRNADMQADKRLDLIRNAVGDDNFAQLDANGIAEKLLGDTVFSNVMMLGFAWQRGLLPLSQAALMKAIELNGVAIERNKEAFGWGRVAATDVKVITDLLNTDEIRVEEVKPEPGLDELINIRDKHLLSYQNRRWADRYTDMVKQVRKSEETLGETSQLLTRAVAQQLYRLIAFKDEYEVARLFAETDFMKEVNNTFEGDFKVHFHLAPPIMNWGTDA
jgi:indolepyruvate ferredoxin oxidoreductase